MALPKFWWLDASDVHECRRMLDSVRSKQLAEWDWVRFDDDAYEGEKDAYDSLYRSVCMRSMFEGKAVISYGIPRVQARIAEDLKDIPDGVMMVVVAELDKSCVLFKRAQKLLEDKKARIDQFEPLTKASACEWISARASSLGVDAPDVSCRVLADVVGLDKNGITAELKKLRSFLGKGGQATPAIVQKLCIGGGMGTVMEMASALLANDKDKAMEYLRRLMARGEEPLKICGYLMDWVTRINIVACCGGDVDKCKAAAATMLKWQPAKKGDASFSPDEDEESARLRETFSVGRGKAMKMYPQTNSFYYNCKEFTESGRPVAWARRALLEMGRLQVVLRTREIDPEFAMRQYVARLLSGDFQEVKK